jgi:hypothetical protein
VFGAQRGNVYKRYSTKSQHHSITSLFSCSGALVEIYTLALAAIIVLLESQQKVEFITKEHLDLLHKYALFLKYVWGRGCLYLVAGKFPFGFGFWLGTNLLINVVKMIPGSLQLTQGKFGNLFVGCVSYSCCWH